MAFLRFQEDSIGQVAYSDNRQYRVEASIDLGYRIEVTMLGENHSYSAGWHPTKEIAERVCQIHENHHDGYIILASQLHERRRK